MAKRFTDTNKWDHSWFRKLTPRMKVAWIYLLDKCDHAGVWTSDFEALSFNIGETITKNEFEIAFTDKIKPVDSDKYLINAFIDFQYGVLNPQNRVHASVIKRVEKLGPYKDLKSPLQGAKDKDKDQDKVLEQDKDQEKEKEKDKGTVRTPEQRTEEKARIESNRKVWESYRDAYHNRYKVEPVRNGTINSQIAALVKRLGADEAVAVVKFYLTHNDGFYLKKTHAIGLCLADCESLHTQMSRGRAITSNDVRRAENTLSMQQQLDESKKGGF